MNDQQNDLIGKLQTVREELETINQRVAGLRHTPKELREARLETFKLAFEAKKKEETELMKQLRAL